MTARRTALVNGLKLLTSLLENSNPSSSFFGNAITMTISSNSHRIRTSKARTASRNKLWLNRLFKRSGVNCVHKPPTKKLKDGRQWSPGWIQVDVERKTGATKSRIDVYFYSPKNRHMIRTVKNATTYQRALDENGGDEDVAFDKLGRRG
jgi:hypothetical protein